MKGLYRYFKYLYLNIKIMSQKVNWLLNNKIKFVVIS